MRIHPKPIQRIIAIVCLVSLFLVGINELRSRFVLVNPIPTDSYEYEFEFLNGKVPANPHGITR
ncbi:hypothetical protein ACFQ88_04470 [Paenibacillus sp. NPDC056579]|uniref:hypothetical protein n=1 Tax=unclassified Paenibacillus TaxID=185978 RepID=UPI001EF8E63B|nr:hypothetical protein [Paenibacillus sp. H1-7]ULL16251.1 hypothetical protein DVH26_18435 [Paenibacillus sp. H1-7]